MQRASIQDTTSIFWILLSFKKEKVQWRNIRLDLKILDGLFFRLFWIVMVICSRSWKILYFFKNSSLSYHCKYSYTYNTERENVVFWEYMHKREKEETIPLEYQILRSKYYVSIEVYQKRRRRCGHLSEKSPKRVWKETIRLLDSKCKQKKYCWIH